MATMLEIKQEEALKVFYLIEKLQQIFHQPLHYETLENVKNFLGTRQEGVYKEIHEAYYDIVWNWLPRDIQIRLEDRDRNVIILPDL